MSLPRREIVRLLFSTAALRQARGDAPILPGAILDHINIRASDVSRSAMFYHRLFGGEAAKFQDGIGARPTYPLAEAAFITLGSGSPYLILSPASTSNPPGLDHLAIGLEDQQDAMTRLKQNNVTLEYPGQEAIWIRDPDGNFMHSMSRGEWDRLYRAWLANGALPVPPDFHYRRPAFETVALTNLTFQVSDLGVSGAFYRRLFGTRVEARAPDDLRRFGFGDTFLELAHSEPAGPGLDHITVAVKDFGAESARRLLLERGVQSYDRKLAGQVYFRDPDGIQVQLVSSASAP